MAETTQRDEHQLLIGGKWVDASEGTYDIVNPATENVVGKAPNAGASDARAAAEAAKEAQPAWAALSQDERSALMRDAAAAIRAKAADLLPLVIAETGATATVGSRMQVPVAADRFERYARDPRPLLQTPLLPQPA
ncbi:MAG TPA: aldehyde dehydrogenase family protein, partial [Acidimicrobiales bacterium]